MALRGHIEALKEDKLGMQSAIRAAALVSDFAEDYELQLQKASDAAVHAVHAKTTSSPRSLSSDKWKGGSRTGGGDDDDDGDASEEEEEEEEGVTTQGEGGESKHGDSGLRRNRCDRSRSSRRLLTAELKFEVQALQERLEEEEKARKEEQAALVAAADAAKAKAG